MSNEALEDADGLLRTLLRATASLAAMPDRDTWRSFSDAQDKVLRFYRQRIRTLEAEIAASQASAR